MAESKDERSAGAPKVADQQQGYWLHDGAGPSRYISSVEVDQPNIILQASLFDDIGQAAHGLLVEVIGNGLRLTGKCAADTADHAVAWGKAKGFDPVEDQITRTKVSE